jgi:hypothetical protein
MHIVDRRSAPWLLAGAIGWAGIAWIGLQLAGLAPSRAGDDLRLLMEAAGRLARSETLYQVPATGTLAADSLFYSYPPLVAEALQPLVRLPFALVLVAWSAGATIGLLAIARQIGANGRGLLVLTWGAGPFIVPFAVALLFGNMDAWFPFAFGLVLVAFLRPGGASAAAGGVALALITTAKLHPASLGIWLLVRAMRGRDAEAARRVLGVAVVTGLGLLGLSVAVGGTGPWVDYLGFLRSGAAIANLISPLNVGPASQLGLLLGLSDAGARTLQVGIAVVALGVTALASLRLRDPVESIAWALTATLVILPVTWVHYPVALIPPALAALDRRERAANPTRVTLFLGGALLAAAAAVVAPLAIWLGVTCVLAAARASRAAADPAS